MSEVTYNFNESLMFRNPMLKVVSEDEGKYIDLSVVNSDMWLAVGMVWKDSYDIEIPLDEADIDDIIEFFKQWKEWRNG